MNHYKIWNKARGNMPILKGEMTHMVKFCYFCCTRGPMRKVK